MKSGKSWLYKGTAVATILTLIGIWSHLATAFSVYEIHEASTGKFDWSLAGSILASAISAFLILTAIGITKIEKRISEIENNKSNRNKIQVLKDELKSLKRFLFMFAIIEMYGNIYYSIAAKTDDPHFGGIWVTGASIFMFSFSLTLISIVGSKLLSIFAVDEVETVKAKPKYTPDNVIMTVNGKEPSQAPEPTPEPPKKQTFPIQEQKQGETFLP